MNLKNDLNKLQEDLYSVGKRQIAIFIGFFFLNLAMIVYYEHDRTMFHIILQTIHLINIIFLIRVSFPMFRSIRNINIKINRAKEKLKKNGRDSEV